MGQSLSRYPSSLNFTEITDSSSVLASSPPTTPSPGPPPRRRHRQSSSQSSSRVITPYPELQRTRRQSSSSSDSDSSVEEIQAFMRPATRPVRSRTRGGRSRVSGTSSTVVNISSSSDSDSDSSSSSSSSDSSDTTVEPEGDQDEEMETVSQASGRGNRTASAARGGRGRPTSTTAARSTSRTANNSTTAGRTPPPPARTTRPRVTANRRATVAAGTVTATGRTGRGRPRGGPTQSSGGRNSSMASAASAPATPAAPAFTANPIQNPLRNQGPVTFECIVCYETLDSPATILENNGGGANADGAGDRVLSAAAQRRLRLIDANEICIVSCGHLYHKYCLQRWFEEQGRKSCPSCRKTAVGKLIKVFPNFAQVADPIANAFAAVQQQPAHNSGGTGDGTGSAVAAAGGGGGGNDTGDNSGLPPRRRAQPSGCQNPPCADLAMINQTLVSDFNELRERFLTAREELDINRAQITSLEERHAELNTELEELRANNTSSGTKRRRNR